VKRLLLFDIDGTLLTTNGRGRDAFRRSIEHVFGHSFDPGRISFAGKTDQQILTEILAQMGLDGMNDDVLYGRALDLYRDTMLSILDESWVHVLPGIVDLLPRLADHPDVQLGLLTGNLRETAYLKLQLGALDGFFPFGAFGSDHRDRYQLPSIAIGRAYDFTGYRYGGREVVIIGDTEHDIGCGRTASALSVAVCTGRYDRKELEPFEPDFLLDDLTDTEAVIGILTGDPRSTGR
jgi:phosphoglycolate phosphatase-like HAD superfamily hydrolase